MIKPGNFSKQAARLVTYPGYGFVKDRRWRLSVSGIAFQNPEEFNIRKRLVIRMLRKKMDVTPEQTDCDVFRARVAPFMADAGWRLPVYVDIGRQRIRLKNKTKRNGQFTAQISLSENDVSSAAQTGEDGRRFLRYVVSTSHPESPQVEGTIHLLNPRGISVISDIDDTIKETAVEDRRELLANTFLREFRSVDGMADVYRNWHRAGADFHYVSSSPWQLFESLLQLQQRDGFPLGTLHLRDFRLTDQLLKRVMILRRQGKATAIHRLLKNLPDRKFILVGDSGEKDPEIYRKACRRRPEQIAGVFIRELKARPISSERIRRLNKNPDLVRCLKFATPDELQELAQSILVGT